MKKKKKLEEIAVLGYILHPLLLKSKTKYKNSSNDLRNSKIDGKWWDQWYKMSVPFEYFKYQLWGHNLT